MKRIPLTKGMETLVDDQDYDYLLQWTWQVADNGYGNLYAQSYTSRSEPGGRKFFRMHRVIGKRMGIVGIQVDHRNGNSLDNQRHNLRSATNQENSRNRGSTCGSSSQFKGVSWSVERQKWLAQIQFDSKQYNLGRYESEIEAAKAYNKAALEHFGEFAILNPV